MTIPPMQELTASAVAAVVGSHPDAVESAIRWLLGSIMTLITGTGVFLGKMLVRHDRQIDEHGKAIATILLNQQTQHQDNREMMGGIVQQVKDFRTEMRDDIGVIRAEHTAVVQALIAKTTGG